MKVDFYNIRLDNPDRDEVIDLCRSYLKSERCHTLFFLNAHCFNIAQGNPYYARAINSSDLLLNDGIGIKIASMFAGISLKQNLNGTDLIPAILSLAADTGNDAFFVGGRNGVAANAARQAMIKFPGLRVVGSHSGYFNQQQEHSLIETINKSKATVLVLGMGVPKQELWAVEHKSLFTDVRIIVGGGAILDFLSGNISRAPLWIRRLNMEWLYRFYLEPRRMAGRYTKGILLFFFHVMRLLPSAKARQKQLN